MCDLSGAVTGPILIFPLVGDNEKIGLGTISTAATGEVKLNEFIYEGNLVFCL